MKMKSVFQSCKDTQFLREKELTSVVRGQDREGGGDARSSDEQLANVCQPQLPDSSSVWWDKMTSSLLSPVERWLVTTELLVKCLC